MSVTGTTLDSWKEAGVAADFRRDGVRFSLVWDVLRDVVSARVAETGRQALDIVDVGGGTGGLAVPFAALGHNVTVVDPSPDALAAAQRRAAEAGARLTAVQGEAASLDSVAGTKSADLVICHNVLEYVDSPADAMTAIAAVLRPYATVSVLAANAVAAVLHRALAGRFTEARQLLESEKAVGSPRRFTLPGGEAASLDSVAGTKAADLVICHNVLEYVDSPADAMTAIAAVLRPSATVSVLASNAVAAVLHRALAGRFTEARQLLESEKAAEGSGSPRRFTLPALTALIEGAGLRAGEAHGLRIFSGLVPGALLDGDGGGAGGTEALRALEAAAAATPPLRDIAAQLHVLGHR